ncbi:FAD-binding oxidoreductase [Shewanella sedimentimangrovi]|uniref:FAD-binding oxidoreductase n=2 Tax=Shewanella sedimentimangrovi TaxID=2814293 RepID=A0ABX7R6I6_9GAMM|nr:FAD-binding oxidoreductase [Shewanella sedimentimangrovi]
MHKRVIVVGAGIVGLCCALDLRRKGFEVTVLDREGVAAGASSGNAGHFATEQVFPLADPAMLPKLPGMLLDPLGPFRIKPAYFHRALPWFMRFLVNMLPSRRKHNGEAIAALNRRSIAATQALVDFCGCPELLVLKGSLLVFETRDKAVMEAEYHKYADAGVAVRLLSGDEVRQLEPSLSPAITGALYFTEVGHTPDPKALCQAVAAKLLALGGKIEQQGVTTLLPGDGLGLVCDSGELLATDKLLIATGAWSKPLAKAAGNTVPLDTERGYHLMLPQQSGLGRPVASFDRKFIITPMTGGTCLAGTVEFGGLEAPMSRERADCLLPHAKALLPKVFNDARVEQGERWMGFRPSLPDSLPVLGPSGKAGVFFAFGHQHLGLTWAAVTGELISTLMAGDEPELDLGPYSANRFD